MLKIGSGDIIENSKKYDDVDLKNAISKSSKSHKIKDKIGF